MTADAIALWAMWTVDEAGEPPVMRDPLDQSTPRTTEPPNHPLLAGVALVTRTLVDAPIKYQSVRIGLSLWSSALFGQQASEGYDKAIKRRIAVQKVDALEANAN